MSNALPLEIMDEQFCNFFLAVNNPTCFLSKPLSWIISKVENIGHNHFKRMTSVQKCIIGAESNKSIVFAIFFTEIISVTLPPHCPLLENCTIRCPLGLLQDEQGCYSCQCKPGRLSNSIYHLQSFTGDDLFTWNSQKLRRISKVWGDIIFNFVFLQMTVPLTVH